MTRRRVLHVFRYFHPQFTGEGVFVERLAPVFSRLRPDVAHEVLVTDTAAPDAPVELPGLAAVHYLRPGEAGAPAAGLTAWLARHGRRYDVAHLHTHVDRTFAGALALKAQATRLLLSATLDDSIPGLLATYRPALQPLAQALFRLFDGFVAISPKLQAENLRHASRARSHLIPIGISLPPRAPSAADRREARGELDLPQDALVLVCVGGLCRRKDQLMLLKALPQLIAQTPNLVLALVGPAVEPDYAAGLERFVAEQGLTAHVRFAGHSPEPWAWYRAADVFVFASRQEGFGTVMIEAMAHGLPVVARALPGVNDDFVLQGRTGFLFGRDESFVTRLQPLLADPALRARLGAAARLVAAASYDIEAVAARYLELYGYPPVERPRAAMLAGAPPSIWWGRPKAARQTWPPKHVGTRDPSI